MYMWPFSKKRNKGKRKYTKTDAAGKVYSKDEKLKLLMEFEKVGAPISMFCKWYGLGVGTLQNWQRRYKTGGEDALEDNRGGKQPEIVADAVKDEIIKIKLERPGIGVLKIRDYMLRNKFVNVGRDSIDRILRNDPKTAELVQKKRTIFGNSGKEPISFERSKPGEMYQMDIMTFHLRGLYKVYVIGCLDDYSRFIVSIGVYRNQTSDKVVDVLKNAVEKYGMPKELLSDNGRQFYTWRGRNEFQKYLQKSGIRHIRSRPYHPQTCGKIESMYVINHELPRAIFDGKTSADIFKNGEAYKNEEKEILLKKVEERIAEIEKQKIPGVDKLGILRKAVVKSVVDMGLCLIKTGGKNVNQFAG